MRRIRNYVRTHWKLTLVLAVLFVFAVMNLVAYLHARSFTRFAPPGTSLPKLETITTAEKIGVLFTGAHYPRPVVDITPSILNLAYDTLKFSSGDFELEAWHIPKLGAQWMVVLFHGHGACKTSLIREANAFHELNCECLLIDFRAGGGSTGDVCTLGVNEADDVAAAVRLAREVAPKLPVILFGQSMGATAILRAVAHHQVQADGLILESPFDRLLTTVQHRFEIMGVPAFPMARLLVFWGGAQHGFNAFAHNPVDYARHVSIPALLMLGERDPFIRQPEVESIAVALTGPKKFHVFADVGHESYLFRSPEEWKSLVQEFLSDKKK